MDEQMIDQLAGVLAERANLEPEQARQAARAAVDFVKQNLPQIMAAVTGGEDESPLSGTLGGLFGGKQ